MSAEQNRQTVLKFFKRQMELNTMDESLVTDDCQWWAPGFGTMDKATFKNLVAQMAPVMPTMPTMTIVGTTAEGDRVAVEATGSAKLSDGRVYENTYHFLFKLRDGRICLVKEYMDSQRAADMFGGPSK